MPPRAASLLASAPPPILERVRRNLADEDRERAIAMKGTRTRVVFIFDEPMLSLEVGAYTVFYEVDPASRTVRVRHVTGPAPIARTRKVAAPRAATRSVRPRGAHRSSGGPSSC
ncbi:MAG TPA: hypothetical protein VK447_13345 [Myxococcaceae bacterium]|nr:hypothetical protein [Myxococcaceae bacterium]